MQKSLNDITPAELEEVKKLAALFFTPREIAIMLELPQSDFVAACDQEGTACYNSFFAGRLQSEVDLRTSTIKLAKAGSSPAATMAMGLLNQSTIKMMDR